MTRQPLHSRRDFISAGTNRGSPDVDVEPEHPWAFDSALVRPLTVFSQNAMGCEFQVFAPPGQDARFADSIADGFELVQNLEDQMTVFRASSDVSAINRTAATSPVKVESGLFDLLQLAVEIYELSDGTFDITLGPLTKLWGFHRRDGRMPPESEIANALSTVGSQHLKLDCEKRTIQFAIPELEIDLGGIGKGYALDQLSALLESSGVEDFLIHGGQSSIVSRGVRQQQPDTDDAVPWITGISHPIRPATRLAEIRLDGCAIGTSGSGRQRFIHKGKSYCHILDARTGWPADQVLSATAITPSAAEADALATAFFVLGLDGVARICGARKDVSAIIVAESSSGNDLQIESFNIDRADFRLLC